jgi:hypothetical protein
MSRGGGKVIIAGATLRGKSPLYAALVGARAECACTHDFRYFLLRSAQSCEKEGERIFFNLLRAILPNFPVVINGGRLYSAKSKIFFFFADALGSD